MPYAAQLRILGSIKEFKPHRKRGAALAHLQLECVMRHKKLVRDGESHDAADMSKLVGMLRNHNPFQPMRNGYMVFKAGVYTVVVYDAGKRLPPVL